MTTITTNIELANNHLKNEGIIAIPTETVYGLAGNIYSSKAIHKIYELKERPLSNPLIVHIHGIHELEKIAIGIPKVAYSLAEMFWPGPLTLLLPKKSVVPDLVTAGKKTVAVRIPQHQLTISLLKSLDFPLAAPSANPFGSISPTSAAHVKHYFNGKLEHILDGGPCLKGIESTIVGFEHNEPIIYRFGSIPVEHIEQITGRVELKKTIKNSPYTPGMSPHHYAPNTPLIFTDNIKNQIQSYSNKRVGLLLFNNRQQDYDVEIQEILSHNGNLVEASRNLYAAMHKLDKLNLDLIIAERFPNIGLGITINDRLQRASVS